MRCQRTRETTYVISFGEALAEKRRSGDSVQCRCLSGDLAALSFKMVVRSGETGHATVDPRILRDWEEEPCRGR